MSTFSGLFDEIPFISVDRFQAHNLKSSLFFLSHCHSDHMIGLDSEIILPGKLYCSEISSIFLKKQFPNLQHCIEILDLEVPTVLFDPKDGSAKLVVTSLPALHCPGSVMFVFETQNGRILYTGDFRHSKDTLRRYPVLVNSIFEKVFIDSTFLDEEYSSFPTQNESLEIICELTKSWLEKGSKFKVIIETPAQYGLECVVQELYKKLKILVCVEKKQIEKYIYFPEMDNCLSDDINLSSVIIRQKNKFNKSGKDCEKRKNFYYRILKPTAMFWRKWSHNKPIFVHEGNEVYRIAFSNHSSLEEIKDFLHITKPKEVKLNVIPNDASKHKMENVLHKILNLQIQEQNEENKCYDFNNVQKVTAIRSTKINANVCLLPPKRIKFK